MSHIYTDVGQPEISPPGFLSLTVVEEVTPDLTIPRMKTAESGLFFGDVSSKRNPATHLNCIRALYDYYRKEHCNSDDSSNIGLPLVANTPGWVKGLMAYFRQCFSCNLSISTIKELAHALASHPPYEVHISSIKITHLHCQIFYSLNGSIVGLAVSSESSKDLPWCVGLGIVRSIDTQRLAICDNTCSTRHSGNGRSSAAGFYPNSYKFFSGPGVQISVYDCKLTLSHLIMFHQSDLL